MYGTSSSSAALQHITAGLPRDPRLSPVQEKASSYQHQPTKGRGQGQPETNGEENTKQNPDENENPQNDHSLDSPQKPSTTSNESSGKSGLPVPKTATNLRLKKNDALDNGNTRIPPKKRVISDSHWRKDNKPNPSSSNIGPNKAAWANTTTTTASPSPAPEKPPQRRRADLVDQYVKNEPQPRMTSRSTPFGISNIYHASPYTSNDSFIKPKGLTSNAFIGPKLLGRRNTSPQIYDQNDVSKNKFGKVGRSDYTTNATTHAGMPKRHTHTQSTDASSPSSQNSFISRPATSARADQDRTLHAIPERHNPFPSSDRVSPSFKNTSSLPEATSTKAKDERGPHELSKWRSSNVASPGSEDSFSSRPATSARADQDRALNSTPEQHIPVRSSDNMSAISRESSSSPAVAPATTTKHERTPNEAPRRNFDATSPSSETPSSSPSAMSAKLNQDRVSYAIPGRHNSSDIRDSISPSPRTSSPSPAMISPRATERREPIEASKRHNVTNSSSETPASPGNRPPLTKPQSKPIAGSEKQTTNDVSRDSFSRVGPAPVTPATPAAKPPSSSLSSAPSSPSSCISESTVKRAPNTDKWGMDRAIGRDTFSQSSDATSASSWSSLSSPTTTISKGDERIARRTPRDTSAHSNEPPSTPTNLPPMTNNTTPSPASEKSSRNRTPRNTLQRQKQENTEVREGRDAERRPFLREQRSLSRFPVRRKSRPETVDEPPAAAAAAADEADEDKPPPVPVHRILPSWDTRRMQSPSQRQSEPASEKPLRDDANKDPREEVRGRQAGERNRRTRSPSRAPVHREKSPETVKADADLDPKGLETLHSTLDLPTPPLFSNRTDEKDIMATRQPSASPQPTSNPDTIDRYLEEKIKQRVAEQVQMRTQTPSPPPAPPSPEPVPEVDTENIDLPDTAAINTTTTTTTTPTMSSIAATPVPGSPREIEAVEEPIVAENKERDLPPHDSSPKDPAPVKLTQRENIPGADRRESTVLSPDSGSRLTNVDDLLSLISSTLSSDSTPKSAPVHNAVSPVAEDSGSMSPVSVPERLSTSKAPRGYENRGLTIRTKDVMRQHETHESRYIRELRTLTSGVIPVLLNSVLDDKANAAGLFGPTANLYEAENFSRPLISMAMSLRSLKELHNDIPTDDPDSLLEWADAAQHVYLAYLSSWRLGFQNVVVNLAPPNPEDDANAETQSLYAGMSQDSDGDVVDQDGIKVDVAYLLKRPLVRLKLFVKTLKGINTVQPSQKARQMTMVYQELVSLARQRSTEERARIEDEAAWSIDTRSARSLRTLVALDDVKIDRTRTVRARDPFDLSLVHSNGQEMSCECEIVLRDNPPKKKAGGDLLICEVDQNGRWLLFAPIERDRASARLGEQDGEVVLMVRGFPGERDWHELLLLQTDDDEIAADWVSMLGSKPVPGAVKRGSNEPDRGRRRDHSPEQPRGPSLPPVKEEEKPASPNKRALIGYQIPTASSPITEPDSVFARPQTPANQPSSSSGLKRSPAKRLSRYARTLDRSVSPAKPQPDATPTPEPGPEPEPEFRPEREQKRERSASPEKRRSRFAEFLHRSVSPEKMRSSRKAKE